LERLNTPILQDIQEAYSCC